MNAIRLDVLIQMIFESSIRFFLVRLNNFFSGLATTFRILHIDDVIVVNWNQLKD